jgi:integrase
LLEAASQFTYGSAITNWVLLLELVLCTGMRKGEAMNLTWNDVDFAAKTVEVSPKSDLAGTWQWHIKDSERRLLPIADDVVNRLTQHLAKQAEGNPYIFVPGLRYQFIQSLRSQGRWTVQRGKNPLNNFNRQFKTLLRKAGIKNCMFHDLGRTCLTHWFKGGLREFDVMRMAGHSSFETTRKFYMGVDRTLLEKTRQVNNAILAPIFGTHLARTPENT